MCTRLIIHGLFCSVSHLSNVDQVYSVITDKSFNVNLECLTDDFVDSSLTQCRLVGLAFSGSIGMTLVILGCALPGYGNWWPFLVVLFYLLSPIPYALSQRYQSGDFGGSNACRELSLFIISGLVVSAYALPCVLAHTEVVSNRFLHFTLLPLLFCITQVEVYSSHNWR